MKKVNALVLGLAVLLAFGCGGDEPEPEIVSDPMLNLRCQLTKIDVDNGPNGYTSTVVYNSSGQIIKMLTNGVRNDSVLLEYNTSGQVSKITQSDHFEMLEYNSKGLVNKSSWYFNSNPGTPATLQFYLIYDYDNNKKLIKQSRFNPGNGNKLESYTDVTYPSANMATLQGYHMQNGTPTLSSTMEYTFDNKIGLNRVVGALSRIDGMISPHNITMTKFTQVGSTVVHTVTYTYQYNSDNFPIQKITIENGVQNNEIVAYSYNCK